MSARCEGVRVECGCHFGRTPTTQSLSAICFASAFIEQGVTGLGALLPSFRPMSLSHFKSTQILDCLLRHLQSWCRSLCNCRPFRRGGLQYSGLCPWWLDFRWLLSRTESSISVVAVACKSFVLAQRQQPIQWKIVAWFYLAFSGMLDRYGPCVGGDRPVTSRCTLH